MASRDIKDCLYVWEGIVVKFHGLVDWSSNSPSRWSWISWGGLMLLYVLFGEVHEKMKGFFQKKEKPEGYMA